VQLSLSKITSIYAFYEVLPESRMSPCFDSRGINMYNMVTTSTTPVLWVRLSSKCGLHRYCPKKWQPLKWAALFGKNTSYGKKRNVAPQQNVSVYMQAMCGSIRHTASSQRRMETQPTVTRRCIGMRSGSRPLATFCWVLSLSSAVSLCAACFVVLLCASEVPTDTQCAHTLSNMASTSGPFWQFVIK